MDNELLLLQFEEIEEKVEKLINKCKSLQATNAGLNARVEHLEKEIHERIEAENKHLEEREFVRSKIDALLDRLEEKEEDQD